MSRDERFAENENLFRRVNERVEDLASPDGPIDFVCECADIDCGERVSLTLDAYEEVRAKSARFLVRTGHERPEIERVVDQGNGYVLVEKVGRAGELASDDDPRTS